MRGYGFDDDFAKKLQEETMVDPIEKQRQYLQKQLDALPRQPAVTREQNDFLDLIDKNIIELKNSLQNIKGDENKIKINWIEGMPLQLKGTMLYSILIANLEPWEPFKGRDEKLMTYEIYFRQQFGIELSKINMNVLKDADGTVAEPFVKSRYTYTKNTSSPEKDEYNKHLCLVNCVQDVIYLSLIFNGLSMENFDKNENKYKLNVDGFLKGIFNNYLGYLDYYLQEDIYLIEKRMELLLYSPILLQRIIDKRQDHLHYLVKKEKMEIDAILKFMENGDYPVENVKNEYLNFIKSSEFKNVGFLSQTGSYFKSIFTFEKAKPEFNFAKAEVEPFKEDYKMFMANFNPKVDKVKNYDSFDHNAPSRTTHAVILISGFTSEGQDQNFNWSPFIKTNDYTNFYFYNWEAKTSWKFMQSFILNIPTMINPFTFLKYKNETNVFLQAKFASKIFGKFLGFIIASRSIFQEQTISLAGFSLGSNVIKHCIKQIHQLSLYDPSICKILSNVIFIAGATYLQKTINWNRILNTCVNNRAIICWSKKDMVLSQLFYFTVNKQALGYQPNTELDAEYYEFEYGHLEYRDGFNVVRDKIDVQFI